MSETVTIETLLNFLAQHGGTIVSSASVSSEEIKQARASGRMYVDQNYLGYIWLPKMGTEVTLLPTNEKELEFYEEMEKKWYPLQIDMPDDLKNPDSIIKYCEKETKRREEEKRLTKSN